MAEYRVIVTGSREREGIDVAAVHRELEELRIWNGEKLLIKVGDCPTGVDPIVQAWCKANGVACQVFYADWVTHGLKGGPVRNGEMVESGGEFCLALNVGNRPIKRTGTGDCSCQAIDAHIRTLTVFVGLPPSEAR